MNGITRGVRNAFRNIIRTVSLVVILGISMGLMLAMLVAYRAVGTKIESVTSSVGTTVSISPAGVRGFEGGGNALTAADIAKVSALSHVTSVSQSLSDRLSSTQTTLQSAVEAGSLGARFNGGDNTTGTGTPPAGAGGQSTTGTTGTSTNAMTRTFTPSVTVVGTTDPQSAIANSQGGGTLTIKSGAVFATTSSDNVALVGTTLATKNSLTVGSTFTAYGQSIKVVGIYDAGNTFSNNQVIMPLKTVQTLSDQAGSVTSATATVDTLTNVASVTTAAKTALGDAADVTNAAAQAETTVKPLENIRTISLYSLIGAIAAAVVIILLTMIMIVRERRREIGVLKAIGANNRAIMSQFIAEAITLTVLGSFVGIVLGVVAGNPITKLLVQNASSSATTAAAAAGPGGMGRGFGSAGRAAAGAQRALSTVTGNVGWDLILYGLGAAVLIALIGSGLAAFFIAKVRPAEVLRNE